MASMSTGQMPSNSPSHTKTSTFCRNYQVRLSFAYIDISQKHFVDSLYKELTLKGIRTFKADENQDRSKSLEIDEHFSSAIEESRFLVVVLSENYVSSARCLDQLIMIVDRWETTGQVVVPIFYEMDPSDFSNQTGKVAEALLKLEQNFERDNETVHKWREALTKMASICGWHSHQWEERILIEQIVADISDGLIYISSSKTSDYVGMGAHIIQLEKMLRLNESNDIHIVGIWGMGGIGKTTIARIIYDRLCCQFEVYCFLENVKENFRKHGLQFLQHKILSEKRKINTWSFNANMNLIKRRLCHRKVLLVLDDVDEMKQLEALAREPNWFGKGSRIIITTRDKHLLDAHGVKHIYEAKYLTKDQALQLFSHHAFKQNNPLKEYLELSKRFTSHAKGLPLALKVLGSFLNNKSIHEWQIVINKLAMIPDLKIHHVLKVSFDGLDDTQREIFLDIACFFNGENKFLVRNILEGCGFFPDIAFAVLKDKTLITFPNDMSVRMHDLLQEMGQEIAKQESEEPGERSRLWIPEDIHLVLTKNKGTRAVEGISLDMSKTTEMFLESNAFSEMGRLRLLNFYASDPPALKSKDKVHLLHGLHSLPNRLRYLNWYRFPLKSLPSNFCAENLIKLKLLDSNVQQLWTGVQNLVNLKEIEFRGCKNLTSIPDLSNAKIIETIDLEGCKSLIELTSSIKYLDKLLKLNLRHCKNLSTLPDSINSKFLEEMNLTCCSNVRKCPEIYADLKALDLSWTSIGQVPESFQKLTVPNLLDLTGCSNISKFPEISGNIEYLYLSETDIEEVPSSIQFLTRLVALKITNNRKLLSLPSSICKLKYLEILDISGCLKFENFPEILEPMEVLTDLYLSQTAIKELPSSIENLEFLEVLMLDNCKKLVRLPRNIQQFSELYLIDLSYCENLCSVPQLPQSLKVLKANNCKSLESLSSISECNIPCLHFANCIKLNLKADAQLAIHDMITKFSCKGGEEGRILFPGNEIPEWFRDTSIGSSVTTKLTTNLKNQLKGFVFCIVIALEEAPGLLKFISPSDYRIRCECYVKADNFEEDEDLKEIIWNWKCFDIDLHLVESDHVLVWFNSLINEDDFFRKCSGEELCFEFYFEGQSEIVNQYKCKVKKCGVILLWDKNKVSISFNSNDEEDEPEPKRSKYIDCLNF